MWMRTCRPPYVCPRPAPFPGAPGFTPAATPPPLPPRLLLPPLDAWYDVRSLLSWLAPKWLGTGPGYCDPPPWLDPSPYWLYMDPGPPWRRWLGPYALGPYADWLNTD